MPATPTLEKPKKTVLRRFRLLRGGHQDFRSSLITSEGERIPAGIKEKGEGGIEKFRPNPKINEGRGYEGRKFDKKGRLKSHGDVIETDKDLVAMFGPVKFASVDNDGVTEAPISYFDSTPDLQKLTSEALREVAEEEEIDISGLRSDKSIIERIVNSRRQ